MPFIHSIETVLCASAKDRIAATWKLSRRERIEVDSPTLNSKLAFHEDDLCLGKVREREREREAGREEGRGHIKGRFDCHERWGPATLVRPMPLAQQKGVSVMLNEEMFVFTQ